MSRTLSSPQRKARESAIRKSQALRYWRRWSRADNDERLHSFCRRQMPVFTEVDQSWLNSLDICLNDGKGAHEFEVFCSPWENWPLDQFRKLLNEPIVHRLLFQPGCIRVHEDHGVVLFKEEICKFDKYLFEDVFMYAAYAGLSSSIDVFRWVREERRCFSSWLSETYLGGQPTYPQYEQTVKLAIQEALRIQELDDCWSIMCDYLFYATCKLS